MRIPFFEFRLTAEHRQELDEAHNRVFNKGVFILGDEVESLESEISEFLNVPYVVAVGNGYDALYISLKLISHKPLNVLIQANAYPATLNAVLNAGHNVVFADIDYRNDGIASMYRSILEKNKIDLILLTHLFGSATKTLGEIPENILLMEDFSQAFASKYSGKFCGTFGNINAASLYPTKNLGAFGDAGIISTSDSSLAEKAKMFRNYGELKYNDNQMTGVNSRLDELQAAFLRVNLKRQSENIKIKKEISENYFKKLNNIEGLILPDRNSESTYHQFVIKIQKRDDLMKYLQKEGISTKIHYPNALFDQKAYKNLDFSKIDKSLVNKWHKSILSLPSFPGLREEEQEYICDKIKTFLS